MPSSAKPEKIQKRDKPPQDPFESSVQGWLHRRGKKPLSKGALDRWRGLSISERVDQQFLESQGFSRDEARALAMAGSGHVRKKDYGAAYLEAGKKMLPEWQHQELHRRARASAGGTQAKRNRRARVDPTQGGALEHKRWLEQQLHELAEKIDKMAPLSSEVHVDAPASGAPVAGPPLPRGTRRLRPKRSTKAKDDRVNRRRVQPLNKAFATLAVDRIINAAFSPVSKTHAVPVGPDGYFGPPVQQSSTDAMDPPQLARYLDANRLVVGMDYEMLHGAGSPELARARASQVLAQNMGAYDNARFHDPELNSVGGLDIDLGGGSAREAGCLSLDTYPYDYGTCIHDLAMGIPFPNGSCRSVRITNALDAIPEYARDPAALVAEVQRVLGEGGRFYYQGPGALTAKTDMRKLAPGLLLVEDHGPGQHAGARDEELTATRQVFVRRPVKIPLVYGADPSYLGSAESGAVDLQMAMAASGATVPAAQAMANLVQKKDEVEVMVPKLRLGTDKWEQIVYGVVLAPDEVDSQDDVISAEEIAKTAHQFLIDARVVGREHDDAMSGASVVESFIAPIDMPYGDGPYGPQLVTRGSWVMAVRVPDNEWQAVLDGEYTGFSVGGWGERADF